VRVLAQSIREGLGLVPALFVRSRLTAVDAAARREGSRFRYQVRLESINEGNTEAIWAGATIQFLNITTEQQLAAHDIHAWGNAGTQVLQPLKFAPGELLGAFLDDGSWGKKLAQNLMMEAVVQAWKPGQQIVLDVVMTSDLPRMDIQIRAWASWRLPDGQQLTDGDPSWQEKIRLDQQRIPCYPLSVGFSP